MLQYDMSRREKLLARFLSVPKDLTWEEFSAVLSGFGFERRNAGGSSRTFVHAGTGTVVVAHQPHPGNIVKPYAIRKAVAALQEGGHL